MTCVNCGGKLKRVGFVTFTHVKTIDNIECKEPRI